MKCTTGSHRLQDIIRPNKVHLTTVLERLGQLELHHLLAQGIIGVDDWKRVSVSGEVPSTVIYEKLESANDDTIRRFFTAIRAAKNLPNGVMKIVNCLEQLADLTMILDQCNPRKGNIDREDFQVQNSIELIVDKITESPVALADWSSQVKYQFLSEPIDIHTIESLEHSPGVKISSIIRSTLQLWIARNPSEKSTFNCLVKILDKCNLKSVSESLRRERDIIKQRLR